jgi:hypothetical protein
MVRKLVFLQGPTSFVPPLAYEAPTPGPTKAWHWLLVGIALAVSAAGFTAAKAAVDTAAATHTPSR